AAGRDRRRESFAARDAVAGELGQLLRAGRDEPPLLEAAGDDARRTERPAREEAARGRLERSPSRAEQVDRGRAAAGDLADVPREELRDRRGVRRERELPRETQRPRRLRQQTLGCLRNRRRLVPPTLHPRTSSFAAVPTLFASIKCRNRCALITPK